MTLSEMRRLLADRQIQLTKSLGQNFLHDGNQLRRIVAAAELSPSDRVLEIGPGLGPLTELLLSGAGEVLAIEKDARLIGVLRERFNVGQASRLPPSPVKSETGATPVLQLLHADALEFLHDEPRDWSLWKMVANLPFSVASAILVELSLTPQPPERMVTTLQYEVALRLVARAGADGYGVLSLLVQLRFESRGVFRIPPGCFFPPPDVDSACIRLHRRAEELLPAAQRAEFVRLVKLAFSQRRKTMLKLLRTVWPEERLLAAFKDLGVPAQARAETVSLEQFVQLTQLLCT